MLEEEIHVIAIPFDEKNNSNNKQATAELFTQAKQTLINRKKYFANYSFCEQILYFSSDSKQILFLKNKIKDKKVVLYIVGHHEYFGKIGISNHETYNDVDYFTPELLVDKIAIEINIMNIKVVYFYVCNSALSYGSVKSYCELFLYYCKNKYKTHNLSVAGFIGFLFEDKKKKKTYVAEKYNDYKKIHRAEEKIIFFN